MERVCAKCGAKFVLLPGKPGYANWCPACSPKYEKGLVGAKIYWEGKHTPVIEVISSLKKARQFNRQSYRRGHGPMACIAPRNSGFGNRDDD